MANKDAPKKRREEKKTSLFFGKGVENWRHILDKYEPNKLLQDKAFAIMENGQKDTQRILLYDKEKPVAAGNVILLGRQRKIVEGLYEWQWGAHLPDWGSGYNAIEKAKDDLVLVPTWLKQALNKPMYISDALFNDLVCISLVEHMKLVDYVMSDMGPDKNDSYFFAFTAVSNDVSHEEAPSIAGSQLRDIVNGVPVEGVDVALHPIPVKK